MLDPSMICEICEQRGHDIFSCGLLRDDPLPERQSISADTAQQFCVDCEEHGHIAANCPHSLDVF